MKKGTEVREIAMDFISASALVGLYLERILQCLVLANAAIQSSHR